MALHTNTTVRMVVPERQVIHATTLRLFPSADGCDVAVEGWTDLDGLAVIWDRHKRMREQTKTCVVGILER